MSVPSEYPFLCVRRKFVFNKKICRNLLLDYYVHALSLLLNLEAARQGRSMLFSDEQKLLFKGGKKGFAKNTKLDFYEMLTKPRLKAI